MFQDQEIDEELELLVLASDGLWDVVPNEASPVHACMLALLSVFCLAVSCPLGLLLVERNLKIFRLSTSTPGDCFSFCQNSKPKLLKWFCPPLSMISLDVFSEFSC